MTDTITICFYGSSDHELEVKLADFYRNDIDLIVDSVLKLQFNNIKIVTGGYGGIMNSIAEKFASKKKGSVKNIEIIGITCDAYDFEYPNVETYNSSNDYSIYNNVVIQSENFADRIQAMIELSDLFIVLPGKQGTLSELLITCESYSFGQYILNGKKTKILIHEYWKTLLNGTSPTNDPYFRKFNDTILEYFDNGNIESHISSFVSENPSTNSSNTSSVVPLSDYWQGMIIELKKNICKSIMGRLYEENGLLARLSIDNENSILGLDFGWFHTYNNTSRNGSYHSYSTQKYIDLTSKFFEQYNSIMLSKFQRNFDYAFLDGLLDNSGNLSYYTGKPIYQKDNSKNDSDFLKLRDFLNESRYGQTLIWKGFKTKLGEEVSNTENENESDVLIFSVFLLLNHRIPKKNIDKINQLLADFLLKASATKSGELFKEKDKDIINQATRAAISQVMARNTSHNIGAHVMNKLIGDLNYDTLFKKKNYNSVELITLYTETIKKWNQDRLKDNKLELTEEEQKQKILLDQISIFNNYVKCRMDYLADISFGTPLMQTNKYAYADLFKELDKVRLLLEHISGLDNFEFEIKFTRNGKEFKKDNQGEGEDDLLVAIPNDILGTQAFYNILENIIRNSAKHAQKPTEIDINGNSIKKTTVFTVNFIDTLEVDTNGEIKRVIDYCECIEVGCTKAHKKEIENSLNEFIVVEVYDNIPVEKPDEKLDLEESDIKEFNDKKTALPKDNKFSSYIDKLVFSQNKKLNENILQENKLRSYSLGLVEMDASAAYLRKRPVEFINHRSYDIQYDESWSRNTEKNKEEGRDQVTHRGTNCRHFLKAFKKVEDGKNYLGYRFFLHRPAVVLVVTDLLNDDIEKKEKLRKEGIWLIEPTEFKKDLTEGKVYPHEFVIHTDLSDYTTKVKINDEETEVKLLEYFKTSLPLRILDIQGKDLLTVLEKKPENIVSACWSKWFDKLKDKNQCSNHTAEHNDYFYNIKWTYNEYACHSIVLIDHLYKVDGSPDAVKAKQLWGELEDKKCYAEALSSLAQSKLPNYYKIVNQHCKNEIGLKKMLKCYIKNMDEMIELKFVESAFTKVVVIDERIQEASVSRDFMTIKFDRLYQKMNVIVPNKDDINLSASSYDITLINKLKQYLGFPINEKEKNGNIQDITIGLNNNDFILIHYSIFERMFEKNEINGMLEYIVNKGINVVLTSGRGTPENLTPKARFVNLSSVINAFVEVRSKYIITYLLNSSRKSNKI